LFSIVLSVLVCFVGFKDRKIVTPACQPERSILAGTDSFWQGLRVRNLLPFSSGVHFPVFNF